MVSKEQYYARKSAGLCTKCGKSVEGSPSKVRCTDCHAKLKPKEPAKKISTNVDLQESTTENKKDIPRSVTDKAESLKKNTVIESAANQRICQKCGEELLTYNLICQKCLKSHIFTKYDALARYDNRCSSCGDTVVENLRIVSKDISQAMKHKDQELFRLVCYRRNPPPQYHAQCHNCYWKINLSYVRGLKTLFDQQGILDESFLTEDDEILDV